MTPGRIVAAAGTVAALGVSLLAGRRGLTRHRTVSSLDPDLRNPALYVLFDVDSPARLRLSRALTDAIGARSTPVDGVSARRERAPGLAGNPDVELFVYEPEGRRRPSGGLVYVHGGGMVGGNPEMSHDIASRFARDLGVVVVSPRYRLAPEHPYPAAIDDCWAALRWLHDHAGDEGVDPERIAVSGSSAGGGLAAVLAQRAHDGGVPVCFQLLVYPMLDDRTVLAPADDEDWLVWTPRSNRFGWTSYLGHPPRPVDDRPYLAAARREDLTGLAPAWIGVGDRDLFAAEDVAYAERLRAAGVACELHIEPGLYHGADVLAEATSEQARSFRARMAEALRPHIGSAD